MFGLQCSLLAALYAGEDDNSMAGISLTLAQSFISLPLPLAGLLLHMLHDHAGEAGS